MPPRRRPARRSPARRTWPTADSWPAEAATTRAAGTNAVLRPALQWRDQRVLHEVLRRRRVHQLQDGVHQQHRPGAHRRRCRALSFSGGGASKMSALNGPVHIGAVPVRRDGRRRVPAVHRSFRDRRAVPDVRQSRLRHHLARRRVHDAEAGDADPAPASQRHGRSVRTAARRSTRHSRRGSSRP